MLRQQQAEQRRRHGLGAEVAGSGSTIFNVECSPRDKNNSRHERYRWSSPWCASLRHQEGRSLLQEELNFFTQICAALTVPTRARSGR
jgi:hypothetical protein